jgi:hypothetical protein
MQHSVRAIMITLNVQHDTQTDLRQRHCTLFRPLEEVKFRRVYAESSEREPASGLGPLSYPPYE